MTQLDYYRVLEIDAAADAKSIKHAYRELALKYHPDRNKDNPDAAGKMMEINEAYAVLSDPKKKANYDTLRNRFGESAHDRFRKSYSDQDIFNGSDIHDIMEEMARSFGLRGFDEIFKDIYGTGGKTFEFGNKGVYVKGFIFSGFLPKFGSRSKKSSGKQSLGKTLSQLLLGRLKEDPFSLRGTDVHDEICVNQEHAKNGGPYAYYLQKQDKKLVVKIPPGIRNGQKIRLAGMGSGGAGKASSGDLYLTVKVNQSLLKKVKDFASNLMK